jgi:predicted metal-dependent hydrolase
MTLDGMEVVVPRGFSQRKIPDLVENKREWIERAMRRLEARRRRLELEPPGLPVRIALPAAGEEWRVEYQPGRPDLRRPFSSNVSGATAREKPGQRLVVTGDSADFAACKQALCRWLNRRARGELVPRLALLAREHGLAYERVSIRQQRTRWGSCSRHQTISLNAKLLLMPSEAVDYVLLHELCHTVEMNHSPRFWTLLQKHDPDYRAHKKLVRAAAKAMPTWLDHSPADEAV